MTPQEILAHYSQNSYHHLNLLDNLPIIYTDFNLVFRFDLFVFEFELNQPNSIQWLD